MRLAAGTFMSTGRMQNIPGRQCGTLRVYQLGLRGPAHLNAAAVESDGLRVLSWPCACPPHVCTAQEASGAAKHQALRCHFLAAKEG